MPSQVLPKHLPPTLLHKLARAGAPNLAELAALDVTSVYWRLATGPDGLTAAQAAERLAEHGPNTLANRVAICCVVPTAVNST